MEFGITLKSDLDVRREVKLAQQAEANGFGYVWTFDSHVLWQECYTRMALWAWNTKKVHIGTLVTNPIVRDITVTASGFATLQKISGGRMDLGIGRGDSSRRVMGKKPTTNDNLMNFVDEFRMLTAGKPVNYDGTDIQLPWADAGIPPVWVAGYGPKVLTAAGKYADGIIMQFADPHLIKWCLEFVKQGAQEAGRDYREIRVLAAAPVWISDDLHAAREHVRWFPALVSNHVVDLLKRYPPQELPPELITYVHDRKGYNYLHHAQVGSDNSQFVSDEITDRYCIVGNVKEQIRRLEELQAVGVHQFNIYLMVGDEEKQVATYGSKIIPHFNGKKRTGKPAKSKAKPAKAKTQTAKSRTAARSAKKK